jgi:hypothetical protein
LKREEEELSKARVLVVGKKLSLLGCVPSCVEAVGTYDSKFGKKKITLK